LRINSASSFITGSTTTRDVFPGENLFHTC